MSDPIGPDIRRYYESIVDPPSTQRPIVRAKPNWRGVSSISAATLLILAAVLGLLPTFQTSIDTPAATPPTTGTAPPVSVPQVIPATTETVPWGFADAASVYPWLVGVVLETSEMMDTSVASLHPVAYGLSSSEPAGILGGISAELSPEVSFELFLFETPESASAYMATNLGGEDSVAIPAGDEYNEEMVRSGSLLMEFQPGSTHADLDRAVAYVNSIIESAASNYSPTLEIVDGPRGDQLPRRTAWISVEGPEDEPAFHVWTILRNGENRESRPVCEYLVRQPILFSQTTYYGLLSDGTILESPRQGGSELSPDDPAYLEVIEACDRYTFSLSAETWGLGRDFGFPQLADVTLLEYGRYTAVAESWIFYFDELPNLNFPPSLQVADSLHVSKMRVHTDGAGRIDGIGFTVQGPHSAIERMFGIDLSESLSGSEPTVRFYVFDSEYPIEEEYCQEILCE